MKTSRSISLRGAFLVSLLTGVAAGWTPLPAAEARLPEGYPATQRQKLSLNVDWRFRLDTGGGDPTATAFDDSSWEIVSAPHTFKLTSLFLDGSKDGEDQKTFHREVGWYRRHFLVTATADEKVFLEFEGAHQVTDAWVNGRHVGRHATGGYTPFHFDITACVQRGGDNVVVLRVDNTRNENVPPDGRRADYVLFSGLYRDVYLVVTAPLHVTFPWEAREAGVFITTPTVNATNATVAVRTTVRNEHSSSRHCTLLTRIVDADGRVVRTLRSRASIAPGADFTFSQVDGITEDLHLWSLEHPYLYRVNTTVCDGERPVDAVEHPLGVRKFELSEERGVLLNGKPIELVGVNRHQQYPYVGDAVPNALHWKDALQFKQIGLNTVRLAHYPHDNAFLDACDRLGLLVTEEPPTWIDLGNETWMDNLEQSLRVMIRNHRNHPSVVIWGGGVNHRGTVRRLHYAAKDEDPTRWTMSNNSAWGGLQAAGVADLFSTMDYHNVAVTDRFLFAMEHSGSRDASSNQVLLSRYLGSPARIGLTVWSGHDTNTLHANGAPDHLPRWGVFDSFRTPKPVAFWYQSELTSAPMVFLATDWNDSKARQVRVFSNCEEVELVLNGFSQGRRRPDTDPNKLNLKHPPFTFPVIWEAGELTARGLIGGKPAAVHTVHTPGPPNRLTLMIDGERPALCADGSDLILAYAHVRDRHGQLVIDATPPITFRTEGPGQIVGDATIGANPLKPERGIAAILIRAENTPGRITVTASMEGLAPVSASVDSVPFEANTLLATARPIYDPLRLQVDIGLGREHIEDGWLGWVGDNSQGALFSFEPTAGVRVELSAVDARHPLRWSGPADVAGPLGRVAEDGVTTKAEAGLRLRFTGLKAGSYRIRTYHHEARAEVDGYNRELPAAKAAPDVAISIDDSLGTGRQLATTIGHSIGQSIDNASLPAHADFDFTANGRDAVTLHFVGGQGRLWLNGFELRAATP